MKLLRNARSKKNGKKDRESGQAIVEFALALPLLLLLLCGILDFGWIYANQYRVENAAYTAARYASFNAAYTGSAQLVTETVAKAKSNLMNGGEGATVNVSFGYKSVSVTVNYPVKTLTFVASTIFGPYYNSKSTSVTTY